MVNCPRLSLFGGELSGVKLSDDDYPVVDCPMVNCPRSDVCVRIHTPSHQRMALFHTVS